MTTESMTQEEFAKNRGKCPACRGIVDPQGEIRKTCPNCGAQWQVRYAPRRVIGYVLAHTVRRYAVHG